MNRGITTDKKELRRKNRRGRRMEKEQEGKEPMKKSRGKRWRKRIRLK